jgi:AraC family transcriptional regulator
LTDLANRPELPKGISGDCVQRVNRAIDFIVQNLERSVRLEDAANVACLSTFHFHRIFRSLIGETLGQFVKRLRLERALSLMAYGRQSSLTEVALACGFDSSSDFSRSFKKHYGVPPSNFDIDLFRDNRREEWQSVDANHRLGRLPPGHNPDGFEVEIRQLPARRVAYIRVLDSFEPGQVEKAASRLITWAEARGIADGQWLGYMWDDPEIVARERCRYDIGLEVLDVEPDGEIGRIEFPAMKVAQVEVRGAIDLELRALDWLFGTWLPRSRYVPADHPCFEAFIGRPFGHGQEYFELLAQIPIVQC